MLWWLRAQLRHLYSVLRWNKTDYEIDEELLYHLEMRARENIEDGMTPDEARRAAVKRFGSVIRVKEDSREIRRGTTIDAIWQDFRYSARLMAKQPGFIFIIIFTIMIGVGSNTAIFSVVHSVLLKPLPYDRPSELAMIWANHQNMGLPRFPTSGVLMGELRDRSRLLQSVGGIWATSGTFTGGGEPEQVKAAWVTENFFSVLGVKPALGRTFLSGDGSHDQVIVLSNGIWQRRFGGDTKIVGKTITYNGFDAMVIGVLPADFMLAFPPDSNVPADIEAWSPQWDGVYQKRGIEYMRMLGRLKPGVTIEQAQSEADSIAEQLRSNDLYFKNVGLGLQFVQLQSDVVKDIRPALLALFAGAGVVLLISCFNVANLLLTRANSRRKEVAVRTAMGASKWRIARQLLIESLAICLAGGALGLLIGWIGLKLLLLIRPESLLLVGPIKLDWMTLAYVVGITLICGLAAGLAPMIDTRKVDLTITLKEEGRSSSGRAHNRTRNLLIVSKIALGFVILIGAGLLARTLMQIRHASPGFNPDHLLTFQISFDIGNDSIPEKINFETRWEQALAALPGVQSVGAVSHLPLDDYPNWYNWYQPEGVTEEQARSLVADLRCVSPGYFQTMGTRLLAGRYFNEQDTAESRDVAIIDEKLANQEWPGQSAIGKKINAQHHMDGPFVHKWTEVVGVVEHIKVHNMLRPVRSQIYMPFTQSTRWHMSYAVRASGDLSSLVPAMREELAKIDKNMAMAKIRPMDDYVSKAMAPTNFTVVLAGIFAAFALLLATIGIYGVISSSVSQRTHEIGIRMALGAAPLDILQLIIKEGLRLTIIGLVIGFAVSFWLTGYLQNMLFGITPTDPMTYAVIVGLIPLAAIVACWRPARKAAAGSPMDALRQQI